MKTTTLLHGRRGEDPHVSAVHQAALRYGSEVQVTRQAGDAAAWARAAAEKKVERIVIAGGDGMVHEVVQGLAPDFPAVELGIIPLGTGNDLARSLDLEIHDVPAAADAAYTCPTGLIDVVKVQDSSTSYFVNAASGGFGGSVTFDVSPHAKQSWGAFAYWFTALGKLGQLTEYDIELDGDGTTYREHVFGVAINNGRYVGGGFPLAPNAYLDDGRLTVTIVPVMSPLQLMGVAVDFSLSRQQQSDEVITLHATSFHLRCQPEMPFSLDGETEKASLHQFTVLPGKLQLGIGRQPALANPPIA